MIIRNEDVKEVIAEIPEGHTHLRMTIKLNDGTEMTLQEAAVANIVRAYITVKTHPVTNKIILKGTKLPDRKEGFAEWQLLE